MKNRRLFWNVVEKIENKIDEGIYPSGTRLPPERVLAEQFEVSRPTIREAIIALEVRGRIEVKTSSGIFVLDRVNQQDNESEISAFELTQARALVEGEAAALAASSITKEELEALADTLVKMNIPEQAHKADKDFHQIIANATRNNALVGAVENFWHLRQTRENILNAYDHVCNASAEQRMKEHTDIYNALKQGDSIKARIAMQQHFNRLINALFDATEAQMLEEIKRKTSETRELYSLNYLAK